MKKILIIIIPIILIVIVIAGIFYATNKTSGNPSKSTSQTVVKSELEQIKDSMKAGAILIDVRTPEEFSLEHAKEAINLPLSDIQNGVTPNVSKGTAIYLYCRSGRRATEAKAILEKEGFAKVINLTSLDNWKNLGGQTVKAT